VKEGSFVVLAAAFNKRKKKETAVQAVATIPQQNTSFHQHG
jgi:hypothetical protein